MERDKLTDMLKGYACLLVVFGHIIIGIRTSGMAVPDVLPLTEKFIWSFHIDLFMFLSGYVYSITGGISHAKSRISFILSKLLNLGVPYFVFSAAYIAVNSLTPGVNNENSLSDILKIWYSPVAQYWFIFALFWLFVIYALLSKFLSNIAITALLYSAFLLFKFFGVNTGFLDSSFNCVLAFGIGTCLKSLNVQKLHPILRIGIVIFHAAAATLAIKTAFYDNFLMDDVLTLLGIFSSVCFISLFVDFQPISHSLLYICKYSFPIYLLHTFFTAATRILLLKMGIQNLALHICAACVSGILFPILIAKFFSRLPYLDFFFYPSRSVKKIKAAKESSSDRS